MSKNLKNPSKQTIGAMLILLATALFSTMGVSLRLLGVDANVAVFALFATATLGLGAYFLLFARHLFSFKGSLIALAILCIANLLNNLTYFIALLKTSIGNAVLSHYTAPIFVALLAPIFLREKIEKITWAAIALSVIGLVLITYPTLQLSSSGQTGADLAGILYGTISGLMFAIVLLALKHISKTSHPLTIIFYMSLTIAALMLPSAVRPLASLHLSLLPLLLLFGMVFGILATSLHVNGVSRISSQHASILAYIEPLLAPFVAFLILGEALTMWIALGGMFIVGGGILIIRRNL